MSNITTYLVSASLILLVIRQIREHPLDARSLAVPVLAVGAAAVMFLHSIPVGGSDLALEAAGVAAGAAMGAIGGLATRLRLGADGRPLGRAGILAAGMWIGGVGARLAFAIAAGNGAGPAIARFSIAHQITGSAAWVAAQARVLRPGRRAVMPSHIGSPRKLSAEGGRNLAVDATRD